MTNLRKTRLALTLNTAPFAIRAEKASDVVAREALLNACFGENRHLRTCQRLRDGRAPAEGLAFSAMAEDRLAGTLRLWHVSAGGIPALMLGPLAVDDSCRKFGVGTALMDHALAAAAARGHRAVILLGVSRAAVFPSLVPPFTLLVGFLALGEAPSISQLVGLVIVVVGFRLTQMM